MLQINVICCVKRQESTISDIRITECYFAIAKCYLPIGKCYFAIAKLRSSFSESCVCKPYTATHCLNSLVIGAKPNNNGISTGVYRGNTLTWGRWGCDPQLCQDRKVPCRNLPWKSAQLGYKREQSYIVICTKKTATLICSSFLVTCYTYTTQQCKLRRAPSCVWAELN